MRGDGLGFDDVGVGGWNAAGLAVSGGGLGWVAARLAVGIIAILRLLREVCRRRLRVICWRGRELGVAVTSRSGLGVDPVRDPALD